MNPRGDSRFGPITTFREEYEFLSNFFPARVALDGVDYPTVEHAFQAAKTVEEAQRRGIRESATPGRAKRLGTKATLRADWEQIKLKIMEDLLRQKFADPGLKAKLRATGDREIVERNHWHDTFWGVCDGKGRNHLGLLLMKIRAESRP